MGDEEIKYGAADVWQFEYRESRKDGNDVVEAAKHANVAARRFAWDMLNLPRRSEGGDKSSAEW